MAKLASVSILKFHLQIVNIQQFNKESSAEIMFRDYITEKSAVQWFEDMLNGVAITDTIPQRVRVLIQEIWTFVRSNFINDNFANIKEYLLVIKYVHKKKLYYILVLFDHLDSL